MRLGKGVNLGAIDENSVFIRIQPGRELVERLVVVVLADAGVQAVVPLVDAADEVLAVDVAVGQEGTAVQAPSVQHRDLVPVADDDEIHLADEGVRGLAVLQLAPARDLYGRPRLRRCRHPRLPPWFSVRSSTVFCRKRADRVTRCEAARSRHPRPQTEVARRSAAPSPPPGSCLAECSPVTLPAKWP
jgi:hypothetical protein